MYLQKWSQTNKREELQLFWNVISWWMGMPVKSHFATCHISSFRHFVLLLIDYFQTLTPWSSTQSIRRHSQYYRYNICGTSGIRAESKPATIRGTNICYGFKTGMLCVLQEAWSDATPGAATLTSSFQRGCRTAKNHRHPAIGISGSW